MNANSDVTRGATRETFEGSGREVYVSETHSDPRGVLPALALGVIVLLLIRFQVSWYWSVCVAAAAVVAAVSVQWKAFLNPERKEVREESRWFGRKLLRQRLIPLSDFDAVVVRHYKDSDSEDWTVGVQHRSGRKIWMRRYLGNDARHSKPGYAADGFALMLGDKTALPIRDYQPQKPVEWLRSILAR